MSENNQKTKKNTKKLSPENNRRRVGALLLVVSLGVFLLFAARFSYVIFVGKVAGKSLSAKTQSLYQGERTVKAKRGSIFDRNGEVIAEDASTYSIYALINKGYGAEYVKPEEITSVAEVLSEYTDLAESYVIEVLSQTKNKDGLDIKRVEFGSGGQNITIDMKTKIEKKLTKMKIDGIFFDSYPNRIYPNGRFASYFIGYTSLNESSVLEGQMGIEATYDDLLSGKSGKIHYRQDSNQNPIPGTIVVDKEAKDGANIYTTLDKTLQLYMEETMDAAYKKYPSEYMTAILVEAKTGAILAASQRPTFNPETKEEFADKTLKWQNLLVEEAYEPGSTFKAMTVAAAISTGKFAPNATYKAGPYELYDETIKDVHYIANYQTYEQAFIVSSNVGMVHLEEMMDKSNKNTFVNYLKTLGFGKSTGSKLPQEATGKVEYTNPFDVATYSFGQGISVTNLQMVQAYSAITNAGKMLKPQIISKIEYPTSKETKTISPVVTGTPMTSSAARQIIDLMEKVITDENGTGHNYKIEGYNVGAKTGTAQYTKEDGTYTNDGTEYLYSVVQIAPTNDPKYIMYVTVKHPQSLGTEEEDKGPVAMISNAVLKRALDLDKESDNAQSNKNESTTMSDLAGQTVTEAKAYAEDNKLEAVVIGNGETVLSQSPKKGEQLMASQKIVLNTGGELKMPDLSGWSKNDILKFSDLISLSVQFSGKGYAEEQSIPTGTVINKNDQLVIRLRQKE